MMLYEVPSSFVKIDETTGILQNASSNNSVEVSNENEVNSGIILKPGESLSFQNTDLYVRTVGTNKNSAVRVVPFVEGFSAGNSDSGDFDIRLYDSVGILIYSTDAAGTLHEKPIHYVNPESTKAQLVELGKSIVAITPNTYQATYRVTKELCDSAGPLIADLPFSENLTDKCGNEWVSYGNPKIQAGKLVLNGSSYLLCSDLTAKAADTWSIRFYAACAQTSSTGAFFFQTYNANVATSDIRVTRQWIAMTYGSGNSKFVLWGDDTELFTGTLNKEYLYELTYDGTNVRVYVDDVLKLTKAVDLKLGGAFAIGSTAERHTAGDALVGTIRDFKVYSGLVLHAD